MEQVLREISANMIERYSTRYRDMGYNVRTLGWGSSEQQCYRFSQTLNTGIDFGNKSILDIGCGFGDYAEFLDNAGVNITSYHGVDINPDLIGEAQERHKGKSKRDFSVLDLADTLPEEPLGDIGIMLGVLNLNLKGEMDNYEYTYGFIKQALSLVRDVLIVDFISTQCVDDYPKEDFIFYHDPIQILNYGLTLSDNVSLKHDYLPIPQKEFMMIVKR